MCDYSLHHIGSRPARVDDQVVTTELSRAHARGFAAVGELGAKLVVDEVPPKVAVCLMPGTELCFDDDVRYDRAFSLFGRGRIHQKLARFRQIDLDDPHVQHDALEFPDGRIVKVSRLIAGQTARVLQLPVAAAHADHEHAHAGAVRTYEPRLVLNRVSSNAGMASILMPSQNAVMLWRTCRRTAVELSFALEQAVRRLRLRMPPAMPTPAFPDGAVVMPIGAGSGASHGPAANAARRPERDGQIKTAA